MRHTTLFGVILGVLFAAVIPAAGAGETAAPRRIIQGQPAGPGEYPWFASVFDNDGQFCGASLIAPEWVLSAAHCFFDERNQPSESPNGVGVYLNDADISDVSDAEERTVDRIVGHPNYSGLRNENDIALVRLTAASAQQPVRLVSADQTSFNDPPTLATVIGNGGIVPDASVSSDQLLKVQIPVIADQNCGDVNALLHLCAGNPSPDDFNPGPDSCQGDSGGPLFVADGGTPVQIGVVSYGGAQCGVDEPGVYTQVSTYLEWITGIIGENLPTNSDPGPAAGVPTGASAPIDRVVAAGTDGNDAAAQAREMSQLIFEGNDAAYGVLARSSDFPDALGGSALASYQGPLLFVDTQGNLAAETLQEFVRILDPGATVYVLGGNSAVPATADAALEQAGFEVVRLAGSGREATAVAVADEVLNVVATEGLPFDSVIVATAGNWPDAVAAGQIAAFWGIPILLTPSSALGTAAADALRDYQPGTVLVIGGTSAVSDAAVASIEEITGPSTTIRLGGATRLETSAAVTDYNATQLYPRFDEEFEVDGGTPFTAPELVIAVNLRRGDAFAHVLAAAQLAGNFGGVFAPLDGEGGTVLAPAVLDSICGLDAQIVAAGGTDLVAEGPLLQLQAASAGDGCSQ